MNDEALILPHSHYPENSLWRYQERNLPTFLSSNLPIGKEVLQLLALPLHPMGRESIAALPSPNQQGLRNPVSIERYESLRRSPAHLLGSTTSHELYLNFLIRSSPINR
jgi:hypothetical protein